ncbi:MAG: hypothetical protein KDB00_02565 [Planctomycetales bacterium]|nr:hypothetical protein [Planctomycetales bacterium]
MTHARPLRYSFHAAFVAFAIMLGSFANHAHAQLDRVYGYDSNTASAGTITEVSKNGVQLKVGANTKNFAENEIRKISFQGDPPGLTRARELAIDGQYQQALDELKAVNFNSFERDVIKADAEFYRLLSRAKLALAGQGDRKAAINEAMAYASNHANSFHFFSVVKLLGNLHLASKSHADAVKFFGYLSKAPSAESKIEARYLTGVAQLDQGDIAAAEKAFSDVAAVEVNSADALRLKTLAKAGNAVALAKSGKGDEALEIVNQLVAELNPTDIEMSARIYNAQGAAYEATGDIEGAILSYLHTHLMFSAQPDAHGQALSRLVELWPKVGRTERAAEARQELRDRYPGYAN